jgi:hypothetical protein
MAVPPGWGLPDTAPGVHRSSALVVGSAGRRGDRAPRRGGQWWWRMACAATGGALRRPSRGRDSLAVEDCSPCAGTCGGCRQWRRARVVGG